MKTPTIDGLRFRVPSGVRAHAVVRTGRQPTVLTVTCSLSAHQLSRPELLRTDRVQPIGAGCGVCGSSTRRSGPCAGDGNTAVDIGARTPEGTREAKAVDCRVFSPTIRSPAAVRWARSCVALTGGRPCGPVQSWPRSLGSDAWRRAWKPVPDAPVVGARIPFISTTTHKPMLRDKHPQSLAAPAANRAEVWDSLGRWPGASRTAGPPPGRRIFSSSSRAARWRRKRLSRFSPATGGRATMK